MPVKWLALESIEHRIFTHKSDVWSYGQRFSCVFIAALHCSILSLINPSRNDSFGVDLCFAGISLFFLLLRDFQAPCVDRHKILHHDWKCARYNPGSKFREVFPKNILGAKTMQ